MTSIKDVQLLTLLNHKLFLNANRFNASRHPVPVPTETHGKAQCHSGDPWLADNRTETNTSE